MTSNSLFKHAPKEAILFTSWGDRDDTGQSMVTPNLLLPLMEKSLLQRALEQLVRLGCERIRVVLGTEARRIRDFLQSGERWGCQLSYHYLAQQSTFGSFMRSIDVNAVDHYWLADAAQLPDIPASCGEDSPAGTYLCWHQNDTQHWSGWGRFSGAWLLSRSDGLSYAPLEQQIITDEWLTPHTIAKPLSLNSLSDVLSVSQSLLETLEEELTIGRGGHIHPSARIIAPIWIGEQVKISANAVIGPRTVIGSGSYIDEGTHICESTVMSDSYVGKELDLRRSVVQGEWLANIPLDTVIALQDHSLLANLNGNIARLQIDRFVATVLRIALFPLNVVVRTPPFRKTSHRWLAHFREAFYPGLRDVAAGKVSLVGPATHDFEKTGQPQHSKPRLGLLNDALFSEDTEKNPDVLLSSDLLAKANQGDLRATMRYLRHYLRRVFCDLHPCLLEVSRCNSPSTR